MIIKIRFKNNWVYFDNINKFVNFGEQSYDPETKEILGPTNNPEKCEPILCDILYLDENAKRHEGTKYPHVCVLVEIVKYRNDDNSYFSRHIAFTDTAYLLNDEGKTIERL